MLPIVVLDILLAKVASQWQTTLIRMNGVVKADFDKLFVSNICCRLAALANKLPNIVIDRISSCRRFWGKNIFVNTGPGIEFTTLFVRK